MLNFVLAESALELVPKEIRKLPAVASDAKRRDKEPSEILLDRSFHHSAMSQLKDSEKRGRPDLVHVTLLDVTGTPLYLDGMVRLFVHTHNDLVLEFALKTRIPKNYIRFRGLIEAALVDMPKDGLIRAYPAKIRDLVKRNSSDLVAGLSVQGKRFTMGELAQMVSSAKEPMVLLGGFPHGHFTPETLSACNQLFRIDPRPLEAHVVASRFIYEAEKFKTG